MTIVLIDNRTRNENNLEKASMTTKLILFLKSKYNITVVSTVNEIKNIQLKNVKCIILSGSSLCCTNPSHIPNMRTSIIAISFALKNNIPLLGICFGMQLITWMMGGDVGCSQSTTSYYLKINHIGLVYFNHRDAVIIPPPGFIVTHNHNHYITTMHSKANNIICIQWHPEGTCDGQLWLEKTIYLLVAS